MDTQDAQPLGAPLRRAPGGARLPARPTRSGHLEVQRARRRGLLWLHRAAHEARLDPGDPAPAPLAEPVVVGLQPAAGHERAEVATVIAVVAGPDDAQVEGLGLVEDAVPVVAPAAEAHVAVAVHAVVPGPRSLGQQLQDVLGLLDDDL